jgi:hypothetical protein
MRPHTILIPKHGQVLRINVSGVAFSSKHIRIEAIRTFPSLQTLQEKTVEELAEYKISKLLYIEAQQGRLLPSLGI